MPQQLQSRHGIAITAFETQKYFDKKRENDLWKGQGKVKERFFPLTKVFFYFIFKG